MVFLREVVRCRGARRIDTSEIDSIARDDDGTIVESKYSGSDDRFTASDSNSEREGAKQMTDEWGQNAFTGELQAIREQVDAETLAKVDDAISDRKYNFY